MKFEQTLNQSQAWSIALVYAVQLLKLIKNRYAYYVCKNNKDFHLNILSQIVLDVPKQTNFCIKHFSLLLIFIWSSGENINCKNI